VRLASSSLPIVCLAVLLLALICGTGCDAFLQAIAETDGAGAGDGTTDGAGTGNDASDGADTNTGGLGSGIVADHLAAAAFNAIPAAFIDSARATYHIFYGHTSHGNQAIVGAEMLAGEEARYAVNAGAGSLSITEEWTDLGHEGDLEWVAVTRGVLDEPGNNVNLVMWSWCGGVSDNTEAGINIYLNAMNQLESDYSQVVFVYMTGHLDGTGPSENLHARNNQIRDYCRANSKVLFDFADIESYDPDGTYYPYGSDWCEWCETWCTSHACPDCEDCDHSVCFNCYQKGKAFWWMLARLAGWSGS
jgi:hypothetical protein